MFSGGEGEIVFDRAAPEQSSVSVAFPETSMFTGWQARFEHLMSEDFFGASPDENVTYTSTGIEVTGDETALIIGEFTLNGVTRPVVLDARLTQQGMHPMAEKPWAGFFATTTLKHSDFGLGAYVPAVSDEVELRISIEAMRDEPSDS
ncbi:polyisoprenoid-binding protein YceI [Rhodovulum iodosum]|uniref:Polyisoprenoid-binding protein YceI n=1 Tax=Rhodovulum iodosum TaxID=68291 RepID=A0ABV3XVE2_9RHOB